jgi:hypothetical protein
MGHLAKGLFLLALIPIGLLIAAMLTLLQTGRPAAAGVIIGCDLAVFVLLSAGLLARRSNRRRRD